MRWKKSGDGVFSRRTDYGVRYYWQIGTEKSARDFNDRTACGQAFVTRFIEKNPKYEAMVLDKTWDELFRIFGIAT